MLVVIISLHNIVLCNNTVFTIKLNILYFYNGIYVHIFVCVCVRVLYYVWFADYLVKIHTYYDMMTFNLT
jgi:hypothetical protein